MSIEERADKALFAIDMDCYIRETCETEDSFVDGYKQGAADQQKIDIEKAVKFVHDNYDGYDGADFERELRQAMEE